MFERFTEAAQQVVTLAEEEARLMRHGHVGTEHLLVGLARGGDDVASPILAGHGLTGERARGEVARLVGVGEGEGPGGKLPLTPAAHDAIEATLREALGLGQDRVEPAHLLLGVLRQRDGVARRLLAAAGANPQAVRAEVARRLGADPDPAPGDVEQLLDILKRRGAVADWLRDRGVDEDAVRRLLGRA